jgi:two-component system sensor histidine kinase YesM
MLQSQITPHFLYNTLNSIKMMASIQGSTGILTMTTSLGHLLRSSLSGIGEMTTLQNEIGILEDYMSIIRIQKKGMFNFTKDISDFELLYCTVPKFILQPIAENAIIHGFGNKTGQGEIKVIVSGDKSMLLIELFDNGVGMPPEQLEQLNRLHLEEEKDDDEGSVHIGLRNIVRRIRLIYGEGCGLRFESVEGSFTRVLLALPEKHEERSYEGIDR